MNRSNQNVSIFSVHSFNARRAVQFGYKLSMNDRFILMRSWMHTHTEGQFSRRHNNISFSSTLKDGSKGCRFKDIKYSHPERWDTVRVILTYDEEDRLYNEYLKLVGMGYDLKAVAFGFITTRKIIKPNPLKRWCTRAVLEPLSKIKTELPCDLELLTPSYGDMMARMKFDTLEQIERAIPL